MNPPIAPPSPPLSPFQRQPVQGWRIRLRTLWRLAFVGAVAVRHLLPALLKRRRIALADAACRACHALGSTYLKFGQVIASSPGLVGQDVADAFRSCLDTGPAVEHEELVRAVTRACGRRLEDAYRAFDPQPIGRASIAVVHRATTVEGEAVAIKIRRPGIRERVEDDLRILRGATSLLRRFAAPGDADQLVELVDDFDRNIHDELDFRRERASMERLGRRLEAHGFTRLRAPRAYPALSDDGVLVMEHFDGVPIDRVLDRGDLVDDIVRSWLVTSLVDGEFHGDCHAGNVLVLRDGTLGLIDWGMVGKLDDETRAFLLRLLDASMGDAPAWTDVALFFRRMYGETLLDSFGTTPEEFPSILRHLLGPLLTAPLGESGLADFLARSSEQAALSASAGGGADVRVPSEATRSFEQGFFLWVKQLVFFERYARLHRRSRSIARYALEALPGRVGASLASGSSATRDLHHVGLVVRDLERALTLYRRLGFHLGPANYPVLATDDGAPAQPFGAANTHAMFERSSIELVTLVDGNSPVPLDANRVAVKVPKEHLTRFKEILQRTTAKLAAGLARFEGLHILVLQPHDLLRASFRLSEEGVGHSGIHVAERKVDTLRGSHMETIQFLELSATPEGRVAFTVAADVPDLPFHPNGATELVESLLCVADSDFEDALERFRRYSAEPARRSGTTATFNFERSSLRIVPESALDGVLPGERAPALPVLVAHAVTVRDLDATRDLLTTRGFTVKPLDSDAVFVSASEAMGAAVIFRQQRPDAT